MPGGRRKRKPGSPPNRPILKVPRAFADCPFRMDVSTRRPDAVRADRLARITSAFTEEAIATSATLQAVLARLYRRDPDAIAHANRVAQWSVKLGEELGLEERALDDLERAAWLHDVGKLVVPDAEPGDVDLFGPRSTWLGGEQVDVVFAITRQVPFLRPAGDIVHALHECFDGSGFPEGLKGDVIPRSARILHVTNVYDVLTSLCMAMAVSCDSVNAELVRYSGSRFDPDIVAAWLRCSEGPPVCSSLSVRSSF